MHPHEAEELEFSISGADRFDGFDRGDRLDEGTVDPEVVGRMKNWRGQTITIVKVSDDMFCVAANGSYEADVFATLQEAAAFAKKKFFSCWKCDGSGLFYGRGVVENGVFKGNVGECYQCSGTGISTSKDDKRTAWYWKYRGM